MTGSRNLSPAIGPGTIKVLTVPLVLFASSKVPWEDEAVVFAVRKGFTLDAAACFLCALIVRLKIMGMGYQPADAATDVFVPAPAPRLAFLKRKAAGDGVPAAAWVKTTYMAHDKAELNAAVKQLIITVVATGVLHLRLGLNPPLLVQGALMPLGFLSSGVVRRRLLGAAKEQRCYGERLEGDDSVAATATFAGAPKSIPSEAPAPGSALQQQLQEEEEEEEEEKEEEPTLGAASQVLLPLAAKPTWVRDEDAPLCPACRRRFGVGLWQHHCRGCGLIFCDSCTPPPRLELPLSFGLRGKQRCCRSCASLLQRMHGQAGVDDGGGHFGSFSAYVEADAASAIHQPKSASVSSSSSSSSSGGGNSSGNGSSSSSSSSSSSGGGSSSGNGSSGKGGSGKGGGGPDGGGGGGGAHGPCGDFSVEASDQKARVAKLAKCVAELEAWGALAGPAGLLPGEGQVFLTTSTLRRCARPTHDTWHLCSCVGCCCSYDQCIGARTAAASITNREVAQPRTPPELPLFISFRVECSFRLRSSAACARRRCRAHVVWFFFFFDCVMWRCGSYAAAREGNFEAARDNLLRTLAWRVEGVPSHKRLGYTACITNACPRARLISPFKKTSVWAGFG